jgi:acyl carrier protein
MTNGDTMERVAAVVRQVFRRPDAVVTEATTADDIDGWDSVSHAILLLNVERAFGIRFVPAEVVDLDTIGDLVRAVDARLAADRKGWPA